jgi:hypothetical protein
MYRYREEVFLPAVKTLACGKQQITMTRHQINFKPQNPNVWDIGT